MDDMIEGKRYVNNNDNVKDLADLELEVESAIAATSSKAKKVKQNKDSFFFSTTMSKVKESYTKNNISNNDVASYPNTISHLPGKFLTI